jgi:hypothetical protein
VSNSTLPNCPHCGHPEATLLEGLSRTTVNYLRCDECCYIWTLPKDPPAAPAKADQKSRDSTRYVA